RNEFIKVAASSKIAYSDGALALANVSTVTMDADGKVVGVDDVVNSVVENKPYLVAKKQPQASGTATNGGQHSDKTAEQLLADAAEKARNGGIKERMAYAKLKKELGK